LFKTNLMSKSTPKVFKKTFSDSALLNAHRAKKFSDPKDPKNPNIPKFIPTRGVRIRNDRFVCYNCNVIFANGWKYKTANLGLIALCEQCKTKIVPLKSVDIMANAVQGGGADGGR